MVHFVLYAKLYSKHHHYDIPIYGQQEKIEKYSTADNHYYYSRTTNMYHCRLINLIVIHIVNHPAANGRRKNHQDIAAFPSEKVEENTAILM